jgi:hypothetical protein
VVKDAYVENNKMKKQAWLVMPLALIVFVVIMVFGDLDGDALTQPKVLEHSSKGMLLELPVKSKSQTVSWNVQWSPDSGAARQQVLQLLGQYAADFKQLRPQMEVWAAPGLDARVALARRIGDALAHHNLGQLNQSASPPAARANMNNGALLICAEADSELARHLLAALTPYLSGRISVRFDSELVAQSMKLYLFGKPYFNTEGQASFDEMGL